MNTIPTHDGAAFLTGPTPRVFAVPPRAAFMPSLISGLLKIQPEILAGSTILLPSRRACLTLREAFLNARNGAPLLLPRMRAVGDTDDEIDVIHVGPESVSDLEPIGSLDRILLLSRLVRRERDVTDEQSFRLAKELARFLDEMQTEEIPLERLHEIVPVELSEHWQITLEFLQILTERWPAALTEAGLCDPIIWRNQRIGKEIDRIYLGGLDAPIIAAGISGSLPIVARLLQSIAMADLGCVVLAGFDPTRALDDWPDLSWTHPYSGIKSLLERMDLDPREVRSWPAIPSPNAAHPRTELILDVFSSTFSASEHLNQRALHQEGAVDLTIDESPDLPTEATAIALRLREAVEHESKSALLVTSDRNLARRVAAELRRWEIEIDDSAGMPLDQSAPGSLMLLTARAIIDNSDIVALLATLKHPLVRAGRSLHEFRRHSRLLEIMVLRGPKLHGGVMALADELKSRTAKPSIDLNKQREVVEIVEEFAAAASHFATMAQKSAVGLDELLEVHLAFVETLVRDENNETTQFWSKEAGETLAQFLEHLRAAASHAGQIDPQGYPAILAVLMMDQAVRPHRRSDFRLSILGQFESRLQNADLVVIGGLNEGVWPRNVAPNPWANRAMRQALGLPDDRLRMGAAALDFLCLATAPEVVLSRARKDQNGSPNAPSRWLARMDAILKADGVINRSNATSPYVAWADQIDRPEGLYPRPIQAPAPRPQRDARPVELWATDVENLVRDPYSVYARRILSLEPLDPIDADPGAADRGLIIHSILERFVRAYPTTLPEAAIDRLLAEGREVFASLAHQPQVQALWWPRFETVAAWFIGIEQDRRQKISAVYAEVRGALSLDIADRTYRIRARADRIEIDHDGVISILDYKTGSIPSAALVRDGISPQLPLEGAIALADGFSVKSGGRLGELLHVGLSGGEKGGVLQDPTLKNKKPVTTAEDLGRQAGQWLESLIRFFDSPSTPYFAVPYPEVAPRYNPYGHLERVAEWRGGHG